MKPDTEEWEQVSGPSKTRHEGTYTHRMWVQSGWIYRIEEWSAGNMVNRQVVFVPDDHEAAAAAEIIGTGRTL